MRGAITCSLIEPYQRETRHLYAMLIDEDANFTGWKIENGLTIASCAHNNIYVRICIHIYYRYTFKSIQNQQVVSRLIDETRGVKPRIIGTTY